MAVVKIDAKDLPAVPMADSDKVEVGDVVLAVGNPFGVGQTVTTGIVSATDRAGMGIEDYEDFIQTDAAINPGNSGGALVDIEGRLIGINTAIYSRTGGNQGMGFAIPSDLARSVMDSLIEVRPSHARLSGRHDPGRHPGAGQGIQAQGRDRRAGRRRRAQTARPTRPDSRDGDVVLEFNGKKVADSRRLRLAVADTKPGTTVPVKILRDGIDQDAGSHRASSCPAAEQLAENNAGSSQDTGTLNGVAVGDLDRRPAQQFNIPKTSKAP